MTGTMNTRSLKAKLRPFIKPYQLIFRRLKKRSRGWIMYPLRALPVSSEKIGPPKGLYPSMKSWTSKLGKKAGEGYTQVAPSEPLHRIPPKTIEPEVHWIIRKEYERVSPEAVVAHLNHARVWVTHNSLGHVNSTATITSNDQIIAPLSDEFKSDPENHTIFTQFKLPAVHKINGTALSLVTMKGEQFYHWIFDMLPKLASLNRTGISLREVDQIIVNSRSSGFMKETLGIIGLPEDKLIDTQTYPHIKADRMIVPSTPAGVGNPTAWICQYLRDTFLPVKAELPADTSKRVFISRSQAQFRRILNEAEVLRAIGAFGFKPYVLEQMSYKEQVALFAQAEVILAPHGAGLSGLVYCDPGTKVLECYSPQYVNACFYALANTMKLDYHYLLGEGWAPKEGIDLAINHADITMDSNKLIQALEQAGISPVASHTIT